MSSRLALDPAAVDHVHYYWVHTPLGHKRVQREELRCIRPCSSVVFLRTRSAEVEMTETGCSFRILLPLAGVRERIQCVPGPWQEGLDYMSRAKVLAPRSLTEDMTGNCWAASLVEEAWRGSKACTRFGSALEEGKADTEMSSEEFAMEVDMSYLGCKEREDRERTDAALLEGHHTHWSPREGP